jgi:hypothetical protein
MTNETLTTAEQASATSASQQTATESGTAPAEGTQQQQQQEAAQSQASQEQSQQATQSQAASDDTQGKTDDNGKPANTAPEEYADFNLPEGYTLEGEVGTQFKSLAKELGLNQEQAQKLVDLDVKRSTAQMEAVHKASSEWLAAAQVDKEYGGDAFAENAAIAKKAIDTFGTQALKDLMQQAGLGNHPEMIRTFYRIGKAISEDRFVGGGNGDKSGGTDLTSRAADKLYGS